MFRFFKKKKEQIKDHQCNFHHCVGFYYKLYRTQYTNGLDRVIVYARVQCSCGNYIDREVSTEKFVPSMYSWNNSERERYIKELEKKDILDECSFNIETNLYSNRVY